MCTFSTEMRVMGLKKHSLPSAKHTNPKSLLLGELSSSLAALAPTGTLHSMSLFELSFFFYLFFVRHYEFYSSFGCCVHSCWFSLLNSLVSFQGSSLDSRTRIKTLAYDTIVANRSDQCSHAFKARWACCPHQLACCVPTCSSSFGCPWFPFAPLFAPTLHIQAVFLTGISAWCQRWLSR
jgi:hypothetical protein